MKTILLQVLLLAVTGMLSFQLRLSLLNPALFLEDDETQLREVLYLPKPEGLKIISFGYRNAFSNLLWFNTVNYFGKHYKGSRDYRWLNHMCHIVTDLNPRAYHVYDFCSLMLAWEARQPLKGEEMFSKAISSDPENWRYYYLRGMNRLLLLDDPEGALSDFQTSSRKPGSHHVVGRIAGKKMADLATPESALEFLAELIESADSDLARQALSDRMADIEKDMRKKIDE